MKITFEQIRNIISEYRKEDLFEYCYQQLDNNKSKTFPFWYIFTLIKWTIIYGETKSPPKQLTSKEFSEIFNLISNFNEEHILQFFKEKQIDRAFQILHNQQFYLQKTVYREIFATQLKIFSSIKGKYNIEKSFFEKTGLTILEFLYIQQIFWFYVDVEKLKKDGLYFDGFFDIDFLELASKITSKEKVVSFIYLLTLNPNNAEESISNFKHRIKNEDLQTMEMSFFTMLPFVIWKNQLKLIHKSIFKYTINYYIYDFMKSQDENFTTDFGRRLEKYIKLGLNEIQVSFKTEEELKKILPIGSNLTDFFIEKDNIFVESKAIEMNAYPSVNPTDEQIYHTLKPSIFKAYFEQLIPVSKFINPNRESWGIIITYKELFWGSFTSLFEIAKSKYNIDFSHIPPENVFLIDIYTWDKIIQIVKDKKATLLDILKKAKYNNSKFETRKQLFDMHLDDYKIRKLDLSYLVEEINHLNKNQLK